MKNFENVDFYFENKGSEKGFPTMFFHEVQIYPNMKTFVSDVIGTAQMYLQTAGFDNIVVEKADGRVLNFIKDGKFFGSTEIGVYLDYAYAEQELPDGHVLVELESFDWEDFENLQKVA